MKMHFGRLCSSYHYHHTEYCYFIIDSVLVSKDWHQGLANGSVDKVLSVLLWEPQLDPKHLYNKTGMMLACTWNPRAGKADIGEYLELLGQAL